MSTGSRIGSILSYPREQADGTTEVTKKRPEKLEFAGAWRNTNWIRTMQNAG